MGLGDRPVLFPDVDGPLIPIDGHHNTVEHHR